MPDALDNELFVDDDGNIYYRTYLSPGEVRKLVGQFGDNRAAVRTLGREVQKGVREKGGAFAINQERIQRELDEERRNSPTRAEQVTQLLLDFNRGARISVEAGNEGYTLNG